MIVREVKRLTGNPHPGSARVPAPRRNPSDDPRDAGRMWFRRPLATGNECRGRWIDGILSAPSMFDPPCGSRPGDGRRPRTPGSRPGLPTFVPPGFKLFFVPSAWVVRTDLRHCFRIASTAQTIFCSSQSFSSSCRRMPPAPFPPADPSMI